MANYKQMMDMPYLGCYSLEELPKKEITLTIKSIAAGKIIGEGGKTSKKPVATWVESGGVIKPMVLNSTNCKIISDLAKSTDTDDWIGLRITIFAGKVTFGGKLVDGLQIRPFLADPVKPAPAKTTTPAPTAPVVSCTDCKKSITAYGTNTPAMIAASSKLKFGRELCVDCAKTAAAIRAEADQTTPDTTDADKEKQE